MEEKGCYVPFDWRRDFDDHYLKDIRFICHFNDVTGHASEIESRKADEDCTLENMQADNQSIINGFRCAGEPVIVIEDDYEKAMHLLLVWHVEVCRTDVF